MYFDEYGQPHISPEEERNFCCLSELTRATCDLRNGKEKIVDEFQMYERKNALLLSGEMIRNYGICSQCWKDLDSLQGPLELPADCVEIRSRLGESTRGRYAVPKKAVASLEVLFRDQRRLPISDSTFAHARCTAPGYVEWESDVYKHTVCLYPWKHWLDRSEEDVLIAHSASNRT